MEHRTVILCPLAIERKAAARVAEDRALVVQCGPGAVAAAAAARLALRRVADRIIVFGVAGGLLECEPCPLVTRVVDGEGNDWATPNVTAEAGVTVLGVDAPIWSVADKRAAHERTGATLVDCESHAVARECAQVGAWWRVVRGVSDPADRALPRQTSRWVTADGNTRAWRAAVDLVARPSLIPRVRELADSTERALRAACERLDAVLKDRTFTSFELVRGVRA